MNAKQSTSPPPSGPGLTLRDIYYILFRHKWMIAILSLLGVASSAAIFCFWPFPYTSEARLYIRYVQDTHTPSDIEGRSKVLTPDSRGNGIVNSELEILSSRDLALQVATNLGPKRVLGAGAHSTNIEAAAGFIWTHLTNQVPKDCDVIILRFTAPDPEVVQPILAGVIAAYKTRHAQIHLQAGAGEVLLDKQTDESGNRLKDTIDLLQQEKMKLGITSIEDAKKAEGELMARTQQEKIDAQAELAQVQAVIAALRARLSRNETNAAATNLAATNLAATNLAAANSNSLPSLPPSTDIQSKYQNLTTILNSQRTREAELTSQFTTNNLLVQNAQKHRAETEAQIKALEVENPGLVAMKTTDNGKPVLVSPAALPQNADPNAALQDMAIREAGLQAKIQQLTNQLTQVRAEAARVDEAEGRIMALKSDEEVKEQVHKFFLNASAQALVDVVNGPSSVSNIGDVESPTVPFQDLAKILKATLSVLAFFLAAAFGLPFVIELFFDQSVKRPADIHARIDLPVFISLPSLKHNGKLRVLNPARNVPLLSENSAQTNGSQTPGEPATASALAPTAANGHAAAWDERHELRPHFEAMRDRLMTYFEMVNLTHKPKLVAVTSCGAGAGVTTTAVGLASSLSETGDGNVLLVSMDTQDGEAHHFYKGKLTCGIEDALEKEKRDDALLHQNLYLAKELGANDALPRVLPKRFSHLVPKMRASDYDYIIFDMPPVSQISITPRLARFMDMVLLVVESEKTNRETATRVATMLGESKAHVGIVLNKSRQYLPHRLQQDI